MRLYRSLFVEHRSLTIVTIVFFVSFVVTFSTGFWLVSRVAYVVIIGVPVAYLWSRWNLRGVRVTPERHLDRLQAGQLYEEHITVENRSWLSKLWLEVEDPSDLPGHRAKRVLALGPRRRRRWRVSTPCVRRGLYRVGPVTVTTGDPFGLFRHTRRYGERERVLVYPQAVDLPSFYVPPANLPSEGRFRRRTHYVTPNASGIRPYEYGDSFNRIHWPSTARTAQLMVKLFELDPASDIWVILDLEKDVHVGEGDDSTEEYGVRIAASVARYFLMANRSVGFLTYGSRLEVEEAERGVQQYARILGTLALVRAEGDVSLEELISAEGRRFGRHTTVVVITPSTEEGWVAALGGLTGRGVKLAVILLEPSTFDEEAANSLLVFGTLAASDIYTYLVKRADDLLTALAGGVEAPVSAAARGFR